MALPIMLYDEQRLTPAWGYVFNCAWVNLDESIVSILWKFARLNAIAGPVVVSLAARKTIDPCEGVAFTPEHIYIERLANTFHLSTRLLGIALASKVDPMRMSSQLRWCPACMREGYHSVVHQFECIQSVARYTDAPWKCYAARTRNPLLTGCTRSCLMRLIAVAIAEWDSLPIYDGRNNRAAISPRSGARDCIGCISDRRART